MVSKFDLEPNVMEQRSADLQRGSEAAKQVGVGAQEFIQAKKL